MTPQEARALIAAVPMPLLLVGPDGRIVAANPRAEALFGTSLAGRLYGSVLRRPGLLSAIEAALAGRAAPGTPATGAFTVSAASGDMRYRVTAEPLEGGQGVLVAAEDVSHLSEVVQQRRDFVANVSHELRTPLTALLGFIETLRGPARDDPAARERFLATMAREAERMNRLVSDLLSLSRVEAEERIRPTAPVDLTAVLRAVRASLAPAAEEAGVALEFVLPDARVVVPGDADQLTQVFMNLAENAVKYGGRTVRVVMHPPAPETALRGEAVRVDVVDDGEGIAPEHIPRITERFYRVDSHRSREKGGTGLGLAIVKHIVSRHRGRLRIASEPGKGSEFSVYLPAN
jgi:two-component system phosphate regulon sensor histidine kinase PhoR